MKADTNKKTVVKEEQLKINADLPLSEKDEVKKAEERMRDAQKKIKK